MTGPPPATAAVRVAVRRALTAVGSAVGGSALAGPALDGPVAAAVSGGADSLALAAALAHERPGSYALVVDHGLQEGSAAVASRAAEQCRALGLEAEVLPARDRTVRDPQHRDAGDSAPRAGARSGAAGTGPEARARSLRYAALDAAADRLGLRAVLLGHTLDDQAETVLLGLARGSGARSLAGMAAVRGRYLRPLLGVERATTRAACVEAGLEPWSDPHNDDPAYARVRVRADVLPVLEQALGPGVAAALARTAAQLREDADALEALTPDTHLVAELAVLPPALLARSLKRSAERVCGAAVSSGHVDALRALVVGWHGQGPVALPGGVQVRREGGRLAFGE